MKDHLPQNLILFVESIRYLLHSELVTNKERLRFRICNISGSVRDDCDKKMDWINYLWSSQYTANKNIRFKTTATASRSFESETKLIGRRPINNNRLDTKVVVPLKYLSITFRNLWIYLWLAMK